jgi:two-component system OmpR family sensor kinase
MTLRLRLVLALVALVTVAQAGFFVATYELYRTSEYQRLDTQLRSSAPLIDQQLDQAAGLNSPGGNPQFPAGAGRGPAGPPPGGGQGGPQVVVPPGTYAELRSADGTIVSHIQLSSSSSQPKLPTVLAAAPAGGRLFTVGSSSGSGTFRVLELAGRNQGTTLIAIPTTEVTNALHRLMAIDAAAVLTLLIVLSAGSWLVLRRGLRPLERMAGVARTISAGDLSRRVSPAGGASEVGQLGLALNTMLGDLEVAFAEREATEQRLRQFLADASHELRTPLTSIQGFAELFRVSNEEARVDLPTILRRIEQESARMGILVEDLLLLARLDQPRAAERAPVDLAVLAADACSDAVATASDRPVSLDAPEPVVIAGDQTHLRQALANLVTNALRHTPDGTPIDVSARLVDGWAVVTVRDHGAGFDDETLQHAFDRFWQADKARVGAGAGLGLAIVAGIAGEHGGTATAANADDGGAIVTLRLPLDSPTPAQAGDNQLAAVDVPRSPDLLEQSEPAPSPD